MSSFLFVSETKLDGSNEDDDGDGDGDDDGDGNGNDDNNDDDDDDGDDDNDDDDEGGVGGRGWKLIFIPEICKNLGKIIVLKILALFVVTEVHLGSMIERSKS